MMILQTEPSGKFPQVAAVDLPPRVSLPNHQITNTMPLRYGLAPIVSKGVRLNATFVDDAGDVVCDAKPTKGTGAADEYGEVAIWRSENVPLVRLSSSAKRRLHWKHYVSWGDTSSDGHVLISDLDWQFAIWFKGKITPLPPSLAAYAVNSSPSAVGFVQVASRNVFGGLAAVPAIWKNHTLSKMTLRSAAGAYVLPTSISDSGYVVGCKSPGFGADGPDPDASRRARVTAYETKDGKSTEIDLSSVLPDISKSTRSFIHHLSVNQSGAVLASILIGSDKQATEHAFIHDKERFTEVGRYTDDVVALAFNDNDEVVGSLESPTGKDERAFLWNNGKMIDLSRAFLGSQHVLLTRAVSINAEGWILCDGVKDGHTSQYLLRSE